MRYFVWMLALCTAVTWGMACSNSETTSGCDAAACQSECRSAGYASGSCRGDLCVCDGTTGGSGGSGGSGGTAGTAGTAAGGTNTGGSNAGSGGTAGADAGDDGGDPDACPPACGLTDCSPTRCPPPCSTDCPPTEYCEEDEGIDLCCITSCNNGAAERCDDERFRVPSAAEDPDGIFYLVCADGSGGRIFVSAVSGDCGAGEPDRCRCYSDPPVESIAHAIEYFPCDTAGERNPVDLSAYRGQWLFAGTTTYPDGTGVGTRVCLSGN